MMGGTRRDEVPPDIPATRAEALATVPLFSAFGPRELEELAGLFAERSFRTGDIVCREGEEGDAFFVVLSGELEVLGGSGRVINRLGPGEVLGEMSLLMGGRRAATVVVARSARLLVLDREAFERMLLPNAKVLEYFSRLLSQRLLTMARGEAIAKPITVVTVTGRPGLRGKSLVASTLASLLARASGRAAVLVCAKPPGRRRAGGASVVELSRAPAERVRAALVNRRGTVPRLSVEPDRDQPASAEQLGVLIGKLGDRFPFVVFDLGTGADPVVRAAEEVSDVVVELVERPAAAPAGRGRTRFQLVNLYNAAAQPLPLNSCEPFVVPDDPALHDLGPAAQVEHLGAHPRSVAAPPLHRLARRILGTSVGIAMGGGAAFGIAHVGVLKVLEDNGIPVDLLAGSSMGSIVALGYAAGIRPDEMIDIARRIGTRWMTLSAVVLDFTVTRPALLSGNRLIQIFSPLTGPVRSFEQLTFPCRAVAADIESGERVCIGSGLLELAFRASAAVPMLWAPVRLDGRVLVDGGVVDPVPAEVVREMGADVCIAVNVVPQLKKGVDTVVARMYRRANVLNPLAWLARETNGMPSLFDLVMNSMQALQYELGNFKAISADVRINPDLSAHTWIEFYRALELIERGAEAAERALPEIKRILADRLRAPARG